MDALTIELVTVNPVDRLGRRAADGCGVTAVPAVIEETSKC